MMIVGRGDLHHVLKALLRDGLFVVAEQDRPIDEDRVGFPVSDRFGEGFPPGVPEYLLEYGVERLGMGFPGHVDQLKAEIPLWDVISILEHLGELFEKGGALRDVPPFAKEGQKLPVIDADDEAVGRPPRERRHEIREKRVAIPAGELAQILDEPDPGMSAAGRNDVFNLRVAPGGVFPGGRDEVAERMARRECLAIARCAGQDHRFRGAARNQFDDIRRDVLGYFQGFVPRAVRLALNKLVIHRIPAGARAIREKQVDQGVLSHDAYKWQIAQPSSGSPTGAPRRSIFAISCRVRLWVHVKRRPSGLASS